MYLITSVRICLTSVLVCAPLRKPYVQQILLGALSSVCRSPDTQSARKRYRAWLVSVVKNAGHISPSAIFNL